MKLNQDMLKKAMEEAVQENQAREMHMPADAEMAQQMEKAMEQFAWESIYQKAQSRQRRRMDWILRTAAVFLAVFLVGTAGAYALEKTGGAADDDKEQTYSVTLQEDGIYADVLPEVVVKNATVFFRKSVEKARKYYEKYQDAGAYTIATKVPDRYRDFMSVAIKIQDSDEIVVRNPFCIYEPKYGFDGKYYFVAERNGKKLCLFSINVDTDNGKAYFSYDKMMNRYFLYDSETITNTIFYKIDDGITYAETPKKITVVRNQQENGLKRMTSAQDSAMKEVEAAFQKKSYAQKMDEIFARLKKIQKEPNTRKTEKNIKQQLKEDYIAPKKTRSVPQWVWPVAGVAAVLAVGELAVAGAFRKR